MYEYNAEIVNIVDGDTFDLDIDLGFHIHVRERVRLLDIDTPEKFGKEKELGLIMKEYAEAFFLGMTVKIKSQKDEEAAKTDSFGRWLVYITFADGSDIVGIYNALGVNKKNIMTYSEDNVKKVKTDILDYAI